MTKVNIWKRGDQALHIVWDGELDVIPRSGESVKLPGMLGFSRVRSVWHRPHEKIIDLTIEDIYESLEGPDYNDQAGR